MPKRPRLLRDTCVVGLLIAISLGPIGCGGDIADNALADKSSRSDSAKRACTRMTPGVAVDNNYQWGTPGSFGLQGQQLTYSIDVINYDVGCGSSSFVADVSAPSGFSVSFPTSTISLRSASSGYLWAYVTSPGSIADGDYPLTVTVTRAGSADSASTTSSYKVYSSDTVPPTLYWPTPQDGTTITGRSYNVGVSSNDDHAVEKIELYIDGALKSTIACDNVSYSCRLNYAWPTSGGQHAATFKSYDWFGNVSVLTSSFAVN